LFQVSAAEKEKYFWPQLCCAKNIFQQKLLELSNARHNHRLLRHARNDTSNKTIVLET
jgi:hypothetical protein